MPLPLRRMPSRARAAFRGAFRANFRAGLRASFREFAADRGGSLLVWFAVALVPLAVAVGAGLDYGRAVNLRTRLQNATDAAALAGAVLYTDSSSATTTLAKNAATNYMASFVGQMGSSYGIAYTVTPTVVTSGSNATLYTMNVTATGSIPTTLMKFGGAASTPVATSSTANNPVYTLSLSLANFSSSAYDGNAVYYYIVPSDNSAPSPSALNLLSGTGGSYGNSGSYACNSGTTSSASGGCSGNGVTTTAKASTSVTITASQSVGFALRNVTGGQKSYGNNGYGARPGSINWFYSNVFPPSRYTYSGVTANRSLQTSTTATTPQTGQSSTLPPYAVLNCSQVPGKTIYYYWNDMGGGSDDLDYNDAAFTVTCAKVDNSLGNGVVLTN